MKRREERKKNKSQDRERKREVGEKEGKERCRLCRSRVQAAPVLETSHGFRGSAGLKGITLS